MFELNGHKYTLEEITEAAEAAGISVEEYVAKHKITSSEASGDCLLYTSPSPRD